MDEQSGDAPAPTVWHCFRCSDSRTVIAWLVAALGFVETACYSEDGVVTHAELLWPEGGGVMLGDAGRGADDPHASPPGTGLAYVVTADSEKVYRRAVGAGAEVVLALQDTDYGDRTFSVRDPEGNVWSVGQYRGAPAP